MSSGVKLISELKRRGLFYQCSCDGIEELLNEPKVFYFGVDPSADSLHVGNLLGLVVAYHFMKAGHRCVVLIGGATGRIGDPSFKEGERSIESDDVIDGRCDKIKSQVKNIYGLNKVGGVDVVSNLDWFKDIRYLDFLRDVGKLFTVNSMIKKDFIAHRLRDDSSISYAEFSYSLIQAYDFYYLYENKGCFLQIGGSDQWGNMVAGVDLIRKKAGGLACVMTYPLIEDSSGRKFGKSEGNAVWIDPDMTSIFDLYQFFVRLPDEGIEDLYRKFSVKDIDLIESNIERFSGEVGGIQRLLARDVVEFIHGDKVAEGVERLSRVVYEGVDDGIVNRAEAYMNVVRCRKGDKVLDVLVLSGLSSSKSEARRVLLSGGVRVNGFVVSDVEARVGDFVDKGWFVLERGRVRKLCIVRKRNVFGFWKK